MTDDEAKARIDVLHDEAAAILAEQGLSPVQAHCLVLEWVTVRHELTSKLLAEAAACDKWFRDQVAEAWRKPMTPPRKAPTNSTDPPQRG
jgi:DNA-damage-inducible protein J